MNKSNVMVISPEALERIRRAVLEDIEWPELEIMQDREKMLALQLVCWGNILMGSEPPDEFADWLDEAAKITGAWTSTECLDMANKLEYERKRRGRIYG